MTLIPDLERTLVDAAAAEPRRQRRSRQRLAAASTGGAVLIAALVALAMPAGSGDDAQVSAPAKSESGPAKSESGSATPDSGPATPDSGPATPDSGPANPDNPSSSCPVGQGPSGGDRWRRIDPRPVRSLTLLGCGRLSDGREVQVVARRFRAGGLCLDLYLPSAAAALECATAPASQLKHGAMSVSAYAPAGRAAKSLGGRPLVTGSATIDVARVELYYRTTTDGRRLGVTLIPVRDRQLLVAAGQREAFAVFAFVLPERMLEAQLRGFDASGRPLTRAELPGALLPGR
jgi:hypothetical protein